MRRRRHREQSDVELNVASMLDMAFQLLTFFILTFKPAPIEGQISLRLPPPQPITGGTVKAGSDTSSSETPKGVNTLTISVFPNARGDLGALGVGETSVEGLPGLDRKLKEVFSDPANPFDQVIIQVGSSLRYEVLMQVVDLCTRYKLPNGQKLSKLSFVEAPSG
jgi:biopolymer transport protein ExbD